jgi:hypothetical protein
MVSTAIPTKKSRHRFEQFDHLFRYNRPSPGERLYSNKRSH